MDESLLGLSVLFQSHWEMTNVGSGGGYDWAAAKAVDAESAVGCKKGG